MNSQTVLHAITRDGVRVRMHDLRQGDTFSMSGKTWIAREDPTHDDRGWGINSEEAE